MSLQTNGDVELIQVIKEFPARHKEKPIRAVDELSLTIQSGEFFALLGPSGCGKTTTLRLIAGLERADAGDIRIAGKCMNEVPAFLRPVNTVFQDYVLFPHMTVLQNVMFGLRMSHMPRREARRIAEEMLERVQLLHAVNRKPAQLSGGQQQRVALARALVNKPRVLLLDEPLGALDLKLRREMQTELKAMQQELGITFIFVTHDQDEAMGMANRIAVLEKGRLAQIGTPEEIYTAPSTKFVADFVGEINFIEGIWYDSENERALVRLPDDSVIQAQEPPHRNASQVVVALRPEHVQIQDAEQKLAAQPDCNCFDGRIEQIQYRGAFTFYLVRLSNGLQLKVTRANAHRAETFAEGQAVYALWEWKHAHVMEVTS